MVVKSIFTVSCFVAMALAIGTEDWEMPPPILINLIEKMNAVCSNLTNGTCHRVNKVVFKTSCEKEAYQDTFCQVNRALLNCTGYNPSDLSDFHVDKCTSKKSFITLGAFCSDMQLYLDRFYRKCATIKRKRLGLNIG